MRRIFTLILLSQLSYIGVCAQTSLRKSLSIDRIEVQEENFYGTGTPSNGIINKLGLVNRNFKNYYSYWTFSYPTSISISNIDGSITGKFTSTPIDLTITNKGQVLSISLKNKSQYWIGIDVSSLNYNISYFSGDDLIPYSGEDFPKTLGTLFNFERGEYDYVLLPPHAESEWNLFRIDRAQNGYDIIHNCIKNGSRMDFTIPIYIYETDPVTPELKNMKNKQMYQYAQYTPIKTRINYKGGYYKEGEAFHIHNDYIDIVRPSYDYNMECAKLKFICNVLTSNQRIPSTKNKFGLEVYSK